MSYAGSIRKQRALWALVGLGALVQPAGATQPPECSPAIFGAWVAPPAQPGQEAPVGAVALYVWGGWLDAGAPAEVRVRHELSGEEQLLTLVEPAGRLSWYRTDGSELATGYWKLVQPEIIGGFHVFGEVSEELSAEVDAEASIFSSFITYTNPRARARGSLSVEFHIPEAWEARFVSGTALGVRLGVDAPPETAFASEGDGVTLVYSDGRVVISANPWSCFDIISADWYGGSVLHGLIWPLGLDPARVSLRFELSLEGLAEQIDELARIEAGGLDTGAVDAGSRPPEDARGDASSSEDTWVPGPDEQDVAPEPAAAEQDVSAPESSTASCAASRPSSRTAWVATAGLALLVLCRRRRKASVPSQEGAARP